MCEEVWFINVVHWSLMLMSARGDNMTARDCHSDPSTQILKDTQKTKQIRVKLRTTDTQKLTVQIFL